MIFVANYRVLRAHFLAECEDPLNSAGGPIKDDQIRASSVKDHVAHYVGRKHREAWCPRDDDRSPYLEISLGKQYQITSIITKGSLADRAYVRSYEVHYNSTTSGWIAFGKVVL